MSNQKTVAPTQDTKNSSGAESTTTDSQKRTQSRKTTPGVEEIDNTYEETKNTNPAGEESEMDQNKLDRTLDPEKDNDPTRIRKDANNPDKVDPTRTKK